MLKRWGLLPVCALAIACGGEDEGPSSHQDANYLTFTTGEFEVPIGDSFECFYTDTFTDRELSVESASGIQGPGGHHIVAYYTDVPREPQHHPCDDSEMTNWHQIAGAGGGSEEETLGLPEGFAIKIPPGKQLVLQAHYINTTTSPQRVNDKVTLNLIDPSEVRNYVNYFVTLDEIFEVPAHSPHVSSTVCTVERDFDMILSLPHMHEAGKSFKLEILDAAGQPAQTIIDIPEWNESFVSAPPISYYSESEPLHLTKGTTLRQTCTWDNPTSEPLLFPREMCLTFFYYFPDDMGELVCDTVEQ